MFTPDAMMITIDEIRFTYRRPRLFRAYALCVAADNEGHIYISEFPDSKKVRHRPRRRPEVWDFAFDGFSVYQKTGGIPDFVVFDVILVKDRRATRKVGEILSALRGMDGFDELLEETSAGIIAAAGGGAIAVAAAGLLAELVGFIGDKVEEANDRVLEPVSGTLAMTPARRAEPGGFSDVVQADGFEVEFDVLTFDAAMDTESAAELRHINTAWSDHGSLHIHAPSGSPRPRPGAAGVTG